MSHSVPGLSLRLASHMVELAKKKLNEEERKRCSPRMQRSTWHIRLKADQPDATEYQTASNQLKQGDTFVEHKPACRKNHDVADGRERKRPAEVKFGKNM